MLNAAKNGPAAEIKLKRVHKKKIHQFKKKIHQFKKKNYQFNKIYQNFCLKILKQNYRSKQ
jgi:hypothetical protein